MIVLRDSGTVRSMFVLDDVEMSVLVCGCYGATDQEREYAVESWSNEIVTSLQGPDPAPPPV